MKLKYTLDLLSSHAYCHNSSVNTRYVSLVIYALQLSKGKLHIMDEIHKCTAFYTENDQQK